LLQSPEPPRPSAGAVERALAEVYARPEFAPREDTLVGRWLSALWQWLEDALNTLFQTFGVEGKVGAAITWGVVGVGVVSALILAAWLFRGALRAWLRRGVARRAPRSRPGVEERPGAERWEGEAGRAAAEGRWRDALLALYPALLLRLEVRGALRYDRSKTPGDYRRELARHADAGGAFDAFLLQYEPVAYGAHPLDGAGYLRALEQARALGVAHG
jgi:hypothetical protein